VNLKTQSSGKRCVSSACWTVSEPEVEVCMGTQIPMEWELIGASSGNEFGNRNHDAGMGMANFLCQKIHCLQTTDWLMTAIDVYNTEE